MSGSSNTNNKKKNIEDARRFLWEDDEAAVTSSSQRATGQRGFSTRDFAVDQSKNLMSNMGREDEIGNASAVATSGGSADGRLSDTIAGLFRSSGAPATPGGRFDEYMDAAPSAESDEYISDKQRRLSPVGSAMANAVDSMVTALGRLGLRGTKLVLCLMVGFGLVGGGLYVMSSSGGSDEFLQPTSSDSTNNSVNVDTESVRYTNIKTRIVEAGVTPESELDPNDISPQHKALAWIVEGDKAKVDIDHPALLDRYSLAVFYYASGNAESGGWKNSNGWLSKEGICSWHGIECLPREQEATEENDFQPFTSTYNDNDRITGIVLKNNEIEGELPHEWGVALDRLITLDLERNSLSHVIPASLGNLLNMRSMLLRDNKFSGTLPPELRSLTSLHQLNLAKNDFEGPIPASWSSLKELRNFAVSSNLLTGSFPDVSKMTKLQGLYLDDNDFEGSLPDYFENLPELMDLWLSKNKFNGDISPLADLGIIETIHIFENDFAGTIPNMFDEIFHLRDFLAQDNNFSGEIPRTITHMQAIRTVNLSNNALDGTVPPGLGLLTDVLSIMIDGNQLTGPIPTLLGKLDDITHLSMSNNKLTGTIPSELSMCFRLKELLLNSNNLEGEIPIELGQLSELEKLQLDQNSIMGVSMPSQVCALRQNGLEILVADCADEGKVKCECCTQCQ